MKPRRPAIPGPPGAGPSTPVVATCRRLAGRARTVLLAAAFAALPGTAARAATEAPAHITIRNVNIVDPADGTIARRQRIEVRDGMVVSVRPDRSRQSTEAGLTIDGQGLYAIPGLWDAHVHILQAGVESARRDAGQLIAHGITHARDMGSGLEALSAFRADPKTREAAALHLLAAGPTFWTFELPYGDPAQKQLVRSPGDTDAAVDRLAAAGADLVKVYAGFDQPMLQQLVTGARRNRLQVAGHAQSGLTLEDHARIGVTTVEHFEFNTFQECSADADAAFQRVIAARFRNSGESIPAIQAGFADSVDTPACRAAISRAGAAGGGRFALVPTLHISFLPRDAAQAALTDLPDARREPCELYLRQFGAEHEHEGRQLQNAGRTLMGLVQGSGITILAGTDAPAFCASPGPSLARELGMLGEAGLPLLDILRAATLSPARLFGFGDRHGRILAGRPADLVLLATNPLENAGAYRGPKGVLVGTSWWSDADLERLRRTPDGEP